jgi:outer membrane protein assembly factor BamB
MTDKRRRIPLPSIALAAVLALASSACLSAPAGGASAAGAKAASPAKPAEPAELRATPDTPLGWRGDGTGRFPGATPVTEWGPDKNVVWRAAMPGWSNSQPVVTGNVVFTTAEPTTLLCLSRADGKILWQKTHNYEDLLPPAEKEQALKDLHTAERLRIVEGEPIKQKLQEIARDLANNPNDGYLKGQKASLVRKRDALEARVAKLEMWRAAKADPMIGLSNATPVTDGNAVFALFGNGVGAMYDMQGQAKWAKIVRRAKDPPGRSMSPVLAGGVLVMAIDNEIVALEAGTGQERWRYDAKAPTAGLAAVRMGDAWVIATAEGLLLGATDGKGVGQVKGAARAPQAAPMVRNDVLYLLGDRSRLMIEMLVRQGSGLAVNGLGETTIYEGNYFASPLYHEGCVFLWEKGGVLSIVDAKTGRRIQSKRLDAHGAAYSSPTLGGEFIFLGTDSGEMIVLRPKPTRPAIGKTGIEMEEVARNQLDPFRSSPVFAGGCMYLRTLKDLYCIGGGKPAAQGDKPADKAKDNLPTIEELLGGPKDDGEKPKK